MNLEKGIQDAILNTVDTNLLSDPVYRQGVLEGLCRWRAFLHNDFGPASSATAIKAALRNERAVLRRDISRVAAVQEEAEEDLNFRRHSKNSGSKMDTDANILPYSTRWSYPRVMPVSLRGRFLQDPRDHSRLAQL